ncbi:uncharacterized protein Triagg1_10886 [Trichoderma aggressivum f. europaeum]|uniref:Uncharacterized protein n=1 Tax=Trichoderma aggressivum f. europaeum TaxID=173218 RepID=A0AAE1I5B4_9HYPO|nr:hypothetical protein Triagg1_10886 [Trichoderma aggressivum f. europaeum]
MADLSPCLKCIRLLGANPRAQPRISLGFEEHGDHCGICLHLLTAEDVKFSVAEDHPVLSQRLVTAYHRRTDSLWAAQEDRSLNKVTKLKRATARVACIAQRLGQWLLAKEEA